MGNSISAEVNRTKGTRKRNSVLVGMNKTKDVAAQKKVQKKKELVSSKPSIYLTSHPGHKRPKKLNGDGKRQAGLLIAKADGSDNDGKYLLSNRRKVNVCSKDTAKVISNLSFNVIPTLSPEESFLKIFYSNISQLDVVKYFNFSCWVKSVSGYKRFCLLLSESEVENLASVYKTKCTTNHATSDKEISARLQNKNGFTVREKQISLYNKSGDKLQISVLGGQSPSTAGISLKNSLYPNVTRQFPEPLSTLSHLPDYSVSDDEGKHSYLEYVEYNGSYLFRTEKDHDSKSKAEVNPHCSDGESLIKLKSGTVNNFDERDAGGMENFASFQKQLYSLLRLQTIYESYLITDAKPWWQDISFLHVYNFGIASIFLYFVIT